MVYDNSKDNARADQTIVRPTPGGRSAATPAGSAEDTQTQGFQAEPPPMHAQPASQAAAQPQMQSTSSSENSAASNNPFIAASGNIFSLLKALRNLPTPPTDVSVIRHQFVQLVSVFERALQQQGIDQDTIVYARYAICCTVDEIILNTPWGGRSVWSTNSLLSTYHRESRGGEHFFTILDKSLTQADKSRPLLELLYLCLSSGFKGKLRIDPQGSEKHQAILDKVYQTLFGHDPLTQNPLANNWQSIDTGKRKFGWELPMWVVFSLAAVIILGCFLYFQHNLHTARTPALVQMENLLNTAPPPAQISEPVTTVQDTPADINSLFSAEIAQGLMAVTTNGPDAKLTLWKAFGSGSAKTTPASSTIIQKIAYTLQERPGMIIVAGYSDNIPIKSSQYPTNWHLSLARATAVSQQLKQYGIAPTRLQTEGMGEKDPIADNSTSEGRALNRRIEIILIADIN